MTVKTMLVLQHDEIERTIPYRIVAETACSARWDTGRRRNMWISKFTDYEQEKAARLCAVAKKWYLKTGVPENVKMSVGTFNLWLKLANFCAEL